MTLMPKFKRWLVFPALAEVILYVEETDDKNKDKDNSNGKPLTLGKDWINTLVVRLEAQNK